MSITVDKALLQELLEKAEGDKVTVPTGRYQLREGFTEYPEIEFTNRISKAKANKEEELLNDKAFFERARAIHMQGDPQPTDDPKPTEEALLLQRRLEELEFKFNQANEQLQKDLESKTDVAIKTGAALAGFDMDKYFDNPNALGFKAFRDFVGVDPESRNTFARDERGPLVDPENGNQKMSVDTFFKTAAQDEKWSFMLKAQRNDPTNLNPLQDRNSLNDDGQYSREAWAEQRAQKPHIAYDGRPAPTVNRSTTVDE
jgi:hypothetical protein